jgi:hypothetical protein
MGPVDDMNAAQLDLFLNGEDEEQQDMPQLPRIAQVLQVTSLADGSAWVVELTPDENGDLRPAVERGRDFPTLEQALAFTGHTRARSDGAYVAVIHDGQLV